MRLLDLKPRLLKIDAADSWEWIESVAEADGIIFLCPVCWTQNSGSVGTHSIICWKPHVPLTRAPGPGRWNLVGSSLSDLSLRAGSSSVLLQGAPCKAHFFVENGNIRNA